ncbi:MAG: molybdate ABC transporter substrate-binding protein [Lawsonibacter sp.]|nr:molybdate ABC transporter substrate-binding protein [Lawsonibacter sp.]
MKKLLSLALAAAAALTLTACSSKPKEVELHIFAAASMTETMDQIIENYKSEVPNVTIIPTYDSSGTLLTQIQEGADCDLFISAAQTQMNTLYEEGGLLADTRLDLLENKVALSVPDGNPKGIESFDQLAKLLKSGDVMLAMGNSDVPVGQYTQKIFAFYGLDENAMATAGVLTYGSNVKEVTTQVSEATVDCGIIYGTDAASAGLTVADTATAEMCGQVIYPAAVLGNSQHPDEAKAFLAYLQTDACAQIFEGVGFSPIQ